MTDLLRAGGAPHSCPCPDLDLRIRNGAIWRCATCRRKWVLRSRQIGSASWEGRWERYRWPLAISRRKP